MRDVLIFAYRETIDHLFQREALDDADLFWVVPGTPRQTGSGADILFTNGRIVHARGDVLEVERDRIWFDPLEPCDEPMPCKPLTRGFRYVDR